MSSKISGLDTNSSLGLLPLGGPTIPASSNWSIILPALLYPRRNLLCNIDVDPHRSEPEAWLPLQITRHVVLQRQRTILFYQILHIPAIQKDLDIPVDSL